MSQRKRTLQKAFLVTVAAAAVSTVAACGDDVSFGPSDDDSVSNPPCFDGDCNDECPAAKPTNDSPCFASGLTCYYQTGSCGEDQATCEDGSWNVGPSGTCNPPPPECPDEQPAAGSPCEIDPIAGYYPDSCHYSVDTPCGESSTFMGCQSDEGAGDMVWVVLQPPESCELPPEECQLYGAEDSCDADAGCQWLVPGCTDGPNNVAEGCYPADDCTVTGCGDWGECFAGVHDPCHNSSCGACAAEINVCVGVDTTGP